MQRKHMGLRSRKGATEAFIMIVTINYCCFLQIAHRKMPISEDGSAGDVESIEVAINAVDHT